MHRVTSRGWRTLTWLVGARTFRIFVRAVGSRPGGAAPQGLCSRVPRGKG